jgi:hypothetical protein
MTPCLVSSPARAHGEFVVGSCPENCALDVYVSHHVSDVFVSRKLLNVADVFHLMIGCKCSYSLFTNSLNALFPVHSSAKKGFSCL